MIYDKFLMYQDKEMWSVLENIASKVKKAKDSVAITGGLVPSGDRASIYRSSLNYRPNSWSKEEDYSKKLSDALLDIEIDYWGFKVENSTEPKKKR